MGAGGRPLVIAWAPADDAARLKALDQAERRADVRPRLQALWLLRMQAHPGGGGRARGA